MFFVSQKVMHALIYRAENDGIPRAYEIRDAVKTEFCPDELQVA